MLRRVGLLSLRAVQRGGSPVEIPAWTEASRHTLGATPRFPLRPTQTVWAATKAEPSSEVLALDLVPDGPSGQTACEDGTLVCGRRCSRRSFFSPSANPLISSRGTILVGHALSPLGRLDPGFRSTRRYQLQLAPGSLKQELTPRSPASSCAGQVPRLHSP